MMGRVCLIVPLLSVAGCKSSASPRSAEVAGHTDVSPATVVAREGRAVAGRDLPAGERPNGAAPEMALATRWFEALRARDLEALGRATSLPFVLHATQTQGQCQESQLAARREAVAKTVDCLLIDEWIAKALAAHPTLVFRAVAEFPPWTAAWQREVSGDLKALALTADAPGCEFNFVVLVGKAGVKAVWKDGSTIRPQDIRPPDPPAGGTPSATAAKRIKLASRWFEALRSKDTGALTALTRFPFKMHDASVVVECEGKTAAAPAAMAGAIACLTGNELLMKSLKANAFHGEPLVRAISAKDLPPWASRWRSDVGSEVQPVWFTVLDDGVTWDLIFLVGSGGVRGLWKASWFDPN